MALQEQRGCSYTEVTDDKSFPAWATANPIHVDCHQDFTAKASFSADLLRREKKQQRDVIDTWLSGVMAAEDENLSGSLLRWWSEG